METPFSQLAQPPETIGAMKKRLLIAIPCYNEMELLLQHLDMLGKQSFHEFDVALVISNAMDADALKARVSEKKYPFGIAILKRKMDTGSAGGFHVGEKYALDEGYGAAILADSDAFPSSPDVVEALWGAHKEGYEVAFPVSRLILDGEAIAQCRLIHMYGMVSAKRMREAGLHFAPLYLGSDDLEYESRIMAGSNVKNVDREVVHPMKLFGQGFDRYTNDFANYMVVALAGRGGMKNFLTYFNGMLALLIFGKGYARKAAAFILKCVMLHKYGIYYERFRSDAGSGVHAAAEEFDSVLTHLPPKAYKGGNLVTWNTDSKGPGGIARNLAGMLGRIAREKVLVVNYGIGIRLLLLAVPLGKEVWTASSDGKALMIADNGNPVLHIAKLALFLALLPGFMALSLAMYAVTKLLKPRTWGYGLG